MRKQLILATAILTSAIVAPAWAAQGRGAAQSSRAATAQAGQSGQDARTAARANSQGPEYASPTAIDRVQNSPGQANNNSVLGTGTTGTTTSDTSATASTRSGTAADTRTGATSRTSGTTSDDVNDMDDDSGSGGSNRTAARANSQGPAHASQNAIDHVQNSPGQANNNSVLGTGDTTTGTGTSTSTTTQTRANTGSQRVATTKSKKPKKH